MEPDLHPVEPAPKRLMKSKFLLGLLLGFGVGLIVDHILVGIVLILLLSLAWYAINRNKKKESENFSDD